MLATDALGRRGVRRRRGPALPESVQGIIAARLDALPLEEKALAAGRGRRRQGLLGRARSQRVGQPTRDRGRRAAARARAQGVRPPRAPSSVAGETSTPSATCSCGRRLRTDPARAARREAPARGASGSSRSRRPHRGPGRDARPPLPERARARPRRRRRIERARASGRAAALRDAGDRALPLNAFAAAARFYEAALELWPADDPARAALLRLGRARFTRRGCGLEVLARGARRACSPRATARPPPRPRSSSAQFLRQPGPRETWRKSTSTARAALVEGRPHHRGRRPSRSPIFAPRS